jgi:hypothetical protein
LELIKVVILNSPPDPLSIPIAIGSIQIGGSSGNERTEGELNLKFNVLFRLYT